MKKVIRYLLTLIVIIFAIDVVDALDFAKGTFLNLHLGKDLRMFSMSCGMLFVGSKDIFPSKRILVLALICFVMYLGYVFSEVSIQIGSPINWILLILWGILVAYLIKTREKNKIRLDY